MDKSKLKETLLSGITNNPIFVLVLGMCPMLGASTNLNNAFWLGVSTSFVLILSNLVISLLRKIIPARVRIPSYIVIIATMVTVVELFLIKYMPDIYKNIGGFIAMITVNCIILARAEAYASVNKPGYSVLDGVSIGLGFVLAICLFGSIREILANGSILGYQLFEGPHFKVFEMTAGGFIALAMLMGLFNFVYHMILKKQKHPLRDTEVI